MTDTGPGTPPPPPGPGRYLTVLEVAALWGTDKDTVYATIYARELPYIDLRRAGASRARIRVQESDAHAYMAARKRVAA